MAETPESKQYTYTSTLINQDQFSSVTDDKTLKLSQLSSLKSGQNTVKVYVKFATDTDTQPGGLVISEKYYLDGTTLGKITD